MALSRRALNLQFRMLLLRLGWNEKARPLSLSYTTLTGKGRSRGTDGSHRLEGIFTQLVDRRGDVPGQYFCVSGKASCLTVIRRLHNQGSDDVVSNFFSEQRQKWHPEPEDPKDLGNIGKKIQGEQAPGENEKVLGGGGGRWKHWYMPGDQAPGDDAGFLGGEGRWEDGYMYGEQAPDENEGVPEEGYGRQDWYMTGDQATVEDEEVLGEEYRQQVWYPHMPGGKSQEDQVTEQEAGKDIQSELSDRIIYPVPLPEKRRVTRKTKWICKHLRSTPVADDLHEKLKQWVMTMYPKRSDWQDLLEEFHRDEDKQVWFQIFEVALQEESFQANIKDYLRLMLAYFNGDCYDDVERMAGAMQLAGLQPDVPVWTLLIDTHCKRGRPEKAREIFDQMMFYELEPDRVTISSLIDAYCSTGKPQEAYTFLKEIENKKRPVKVKSYVSIIRAFGNLGQADKADNVFRIFVLQQEDLNHRKYFLLLSALMDVYIQVEDLEKAEPVFENMLLGNLQPEDTSLAGLISLCEKKNLLEKAVTLLLKLESKAMRPGVETLTRLIGWFHKLGLIDEAEMLFEEIKRKKEKLHCSTCVAMYKTYVSAGLLDKARSIFGWSMEKMIEFNASGYEQIIQALLDAGLLHEAQIMRNQMQEQGYTVPYEIERAFIGSQTSF